MLLPAMLLLLQAPPTQVLAAAPTPASNTFIFDGDTYRLNEAKNIEFNQVQDTYVEVGQPDPSHRRAITVTLLAKGQPAEDQWKAYLGLGTYLVQPSERVRAPHNRHTADEAGVYLVKDFGQKGVSLLILRLTTDKGQPVREILVSFDLGGATEKEAAAQLKANQGAWLAGIFALEPVFVEPAKP